MTSKGYIPLTDEEIRTLLGPYYPARADALIEKRAKELTKRQFDRVREAVKRSGLGPRDRLENFLSDLETCERFLTDDFIEDISALLSAFDEKEEYFDDEDGE